MLNVTHTENAPSAIGPYSQAVTANGFLFASGQIALMPGTGAVIGTTIEEQTERVCENIKGILDSNGITFDHVVKTTCFLSDMSHFEKFNEIYGRYFTSKPARSCVAVKTIPKNLLCEIEIIAKL